MAENTRIDSAGFEEAESLVGQIADEFAEQLERGEVADVEEYAARYPAVAETLRRVLPAIQLMRAYPPEQLQEDHQAPGDRRLGDFRLIREVGRGGMGVVYEAEQLSLERRVALKVLPMAGILDDRQLTRFKNEARAAATLMHPNIVPVYAVGSASGTHFYAMQFIDGQSLAEVIGILSQEAKLDRKSQQIAERRDARLAIPPVTNNDTCQESPEQFPREASQGAAVDGLEVAGQAASDTVPVAGCVTELSDRPARRYRRAAALAADVAEALEYAHSMGIVHRDIKPGNLLIDRQGKIWIADFGLAQLESDAGLTMTGDVLGTLRYMSPEQAEGQSGLVDPRSDVYSLGLTLYELLTLRPAFPAKERSKLFHQITNADPPRLRQVEPSAPRDLETIVRKSIAKSPQDRYRSAKEFAADLRRFLDDKPIHAKPPRLLERVKKWRRRNHVAVATALSTFVLAIVLAGILLFRERSITLAALASERVQREVATIQHIKALDAQQRAMLSERELEQRRLVVQSGINDTLAEVARVKGQTDPAATDGAARLYQARELLQRALGLADSGPVNPDQLASLRELAGDLDKEHNHRQLLAALDLAWKTQMTTDPTRSNFRREACIPLLQQALEAFGVELGRLSPEEAAAAIRAQPVVVRDLLLSAMEEWHALAPPSIGMSWGVLASGAILVMSIATDGPAARDGRLKTGDQLVGVGQGSDGSLIDTRQMTATEFAEALSNQKHASLQLQVIPEGGSEPRTYVIQQDTTRSWLAETIEAVDDDPWRARLRKALNTTLRSQREPLLQDLLEELDIERQPVRVLTRFAVKLPVAEDASNLLQEIWRLHPTDLVCILELGSSYLWKMKPPKFEEAVRYYTAAVALDPNNAGARFNLAFAFNSLDRTDDAIREYREAHRLEPDWPAPLVNLSQIFSRQGKVEESISMSRKAIESRPDNPDLRTNFGAELHKLGRTEEAIAEHLEAIRLEPNFALAHMNLACALSEQGKLDEAVAEHREALRLNPKYPLAHYNLGYVLSKQQKWDEAAAHYREAASITPSPFFKQQLEYFLTNTSWELANAREVEKRDPVKAVEWAQEATAMNPDNANHRNNLGVALYRAGRWQSAVDKLEEADKMISGGDREHRMFLAMAYWQLGKKEKAKTCFAAAAAWIDAVPTEEQERFRAEAEELLGLSEEGRAEVIDEYFANTRSDTTHFLVTRGKWYSGKKEYELALADLRAAVEKDPEHSRAWDTWSRVALEYYRQRNWEGAEREAEAAIRLASERPDFLMRIVPLLLMAGKTDEYDAICEQLMGRWEDWTGSDLGNAMVLCSLAPHPAKDPEKLLRLLNRAVEVGPDWTANKVIRIQNRTGDYERGIVEFDSAVSTGFRLADLSIAHSYAGNADQALTSLERAQQAYQELESPNANSDMEFAAILHEAEQLILHHADD